MVASQELLGAAKRVALLEAELEKSTAELKILCTHGDDSSVSEIAKCEEKRMDIYCEYQEALERVSKAAQRYISENIPTLLEKYLILQEQYFEIVKWLCKQQIRDADGEQKTYWEQFQHDHPYRTIWNCYD